MAYLPAGNSVNHLFFDFVDLRLFVNIAEASNMTLGAERSFLSLAAASVRIKRIEEAFGTQLFYRTKRGVTLTSAGNAMLDSAIRILEQAEHLRSDLLEYAQGARGHIRLYANTTAIANFLPAELGAYLGAYPKIDIDLEEHTSLDTVHAVRDGGADIGIVAETADTGSLDVFPYRHEDRMVLAVPKSHPLASRADVDFSETLVYDFVSMHSGSAIHGFINRVVAEIGANIVVRIQVSSFSTMCRLIEANVGIGVLNALTAQDHMHTESIRIVDINDAWATRKMKICTRELGRLPNVMQLLVHQLAEMDPPRDPDDPDV